MESFIYSQYVNPQNHNTIEKPHSLKVKSYV